MQNILFVHSWKYIQFLLRFQTFCLSKKFIRGAYNTALAWIHGEIMVSSPNSMQTILIWMKIYEILTSVKMKYVACYYSISLNNSHSNWFFLSWNFLQKKRKKKMRFNKLTILLVLHVDVLLHAYTMTKGSQKLSHRIKSGNRPKANKLMTNQETKANYYLDHSLFKEMR